MSVKCLGVLSCFTDRVHVPQITDSPLPDYERINNISEKDANLRLINVLPSTPNRWNNTNVLVTQCS